MKSRITVLSLAAALLSMTSFHFPESNSSSLASTEATREAEKAEPSQSVKAKPEPKAQDTITKAAR